MSSFTDEGSPEGTYAFIQWKGTNVCMDFQCDCGHSQHIDAMFCYTVTCPGCGAVWEMPAYVRPRKQCS